MPGKNRRPVIPLIADGYVTGYDASNHRLQVNLSDGQTIANAYTLTFGPSNEQSYNQIEPPRRGDRVLLAFPNNNPNNAILLGSYYGRPNDAIMSGANDDQIFVNCFSHFSGAFEYQDQQGNRTIFCPDGSYINVGSSPTLPTMYRHVYNSSTGTRTTQTYAISARVNPLASAVTMAVSHSSGTSAIIASSGSIQVSGASGATLSFALNGTTVTIDANGNVNIALANTAKVDITGQNTPLLQLGPGGDALALVSKLVTAFNTHLHSGGTLSGLTGAPTVPWTAVTIKSQRVTTDE